MKVFTKLFKRKPKPTKQGGKLEATQTVRNYSLELSNMEETPTYELNGTLTIGSELGDIVLNDPSISPRHCSFTIQENVVSLIDHGSVAGTFVNEKKIQPGRYVILEETDTVSVGDLQIKLNVTVEHVKVQVEEEVEEEEIEEEEEVVEEPKIVLEKPKSSSKVKVTNKYEKKKDKNPVKKVASFTSNYSTNALIRVLAVLSDLLLAYSLFVILHPFDEYRIFVEDAPAQIGQLLDVDWKHMWAAVIEDYAFIGTFLEDSYQFVNATIHITPIVINFLVIRLITTLLFGVSFSEWMFGVRALGNGIWSRVGGCLRVFVGIFTGPLIVFDVPAIISRKTFKEFITLTHTQLASTFYAIVGVLIYIPMVLILVLAAPLFQGFDVPAPISVNDKLDQRVKVAPPTEQVAAAAEAPQTSEPVLEAPSMTATPTVREVRDQGQLFRLELSYDSNNVTLIPDFKFQGQGKKMTYTPYLSVYHHDLQRAVKFEVYKTFNLKELLSLGMGGNFFLFDKFPEMYNYIYSPEQANAAFKAKVNETTIRKFALEVVSFTKMSFELSMENALDTMSDYTPMLKGLVDYKLSLLSLIEYKDFDAVTFIKLGGTYFLKFNYMKQKPYDIFIPLQPTHDAVVYKVTYDKKENLSAMSNKFYKYTLDNTGWMPASHSLIESETMSPLQIVDFFSKLNLKEPKIPASMAQAIYGYYYEKSNEIFKRGDEIEYGVWKGSVDSVFKIIEIVSEAPLPSPMAKPVVEAEPVPQPEAVEDPRLKLKQNFQDLKNAVDGKDKTYFGLEQNTSV